MSADELIRLLGLAPHPKEGGFFRETYRADEALPAGALAPRYRAGRSVSTAIYYLLTPGTYSALHRLKSDEVFHFHLGRPVRMLQLFPEGTGETIVLGPDLPRGQRLQTVVPRGVWQGSFLDPDERAGAGSGEAGDFALLGCTVAPGFDYADYEGGSRDVLLSQYPQFADLIRRLTPD
jgi:predicted cupin superfamily sugar epimerase